MTRRTDTISQACGESSERSCTFVKLKKHSLNIKVSLPILDVEDVFYVYYKELVNTAPWGSVRFLDDKVASYSRTFPLRTLESFQNAKELWLRVFPLCRSQESNTDISLKYAALLFIHGSDFSFSTYRRHISYRTTNCRTRGTQFCSFSKHYRG